MWSSFSLESLVTQPPQKKMTTFSTAKELIILGSLLILYGLSTWNCAMKPLLPLGHIYQARHVHQAQETSLKPGGAKKNHLGI